MRSSLKRSHWKLFSPIRWYQAAEQSVWPMLVVSCFSVRRDVLQNRVTLPLSPEKGSGGHGRALSVLLHERCGTRP